MAGTVTNPRELFMHELGDILYAERVIEKMLAKLQSEVTDEEFAARIEQHIGETRQQIENLNQAFEELGAKPKAERCPGIEGIRDEHDQFVGEAAGPDVLQLFATGTAARVEHYEIAAYSGLAISARAMGERKVLELLEANLKQEKEMLADGEKIKKRLSTEVAKMEKEAAKAAG
jgi:ferritin-like metal-binding protein YciE